jgi:glycosyltransferase involved in cell wall biosynthesis
MIKLLTLRSSMVMGGALGLVTHVQKGLKDIGESSMVYKISKKPERNPRVYHDVEYRNVTIDEFNNLPGYTFIFEPKLDAKYDERVVEWAMDLYMRGKASMFFHDIYDTQHAEILAAVFKSSGRGLFCARPAVLGITGGTRVLLPYYRETFGRKTWEKRIYQAAFMSRISNEKKFRVVVEANRYLPDNKQIHLLGAANRLHVHYMLKKYPEIEPLLNSKGYKMGAGVTILNDYRYSVDITCYPGEYGFIQYVTLEALEAGAIPILDPVAAEGQYPATGILLEEDDFMPAVNDKDLVNAVQRTYSITDVRKMWASYDKILVAHDSRKFAKLLQQEYKK